MLQVPFFICRYLVLNIQVPFSTRQQAIHGTVLFTPDLLTPHTAFPSLPATVPVFWNVSTHFFYQCAHSTQSLSRPRDTTSIDENLTLTERRVRHLERTVLGRYLLSCHTVIRPFVPNIEAKSVPPRVDHHRGQMWLTGNSWMAWPVVGKAYMLWRKQHFIKIWIKIP